MHDVSDLGPFAFPTDPYDDDLDLLFLEDDIDTLHSFDEERGLEEADDSGDFDDDLEH